MPEAEATSGLHKQHIGFVFQSYHLLDDLTVAENLELPLSYRDVSRKDRQSWSPTCSTASRSSARRTCTPASSPAASSSWSPSRARSSPSPQMILADEPTGNLHSAQGKKIMELFRRRSTQPGTTIVQVTHSRGERPYGRRIILLKDGWIVTTDGL